MTRALRRRRRKKFDINEVVWHATPLPQITVLQVLKKKNNPLNLQLLLFYDLITSVTL